MNKPKPEITAYLKTWCGWSEGVRAIMRKYELPYEEKDIICRHLERLRAIAQDAVGPFCPVLVTPLTG